jgi:putative selenium metabolism hydrolase
MGAVDGPDNIEFDDFGNLCWRVDDPTDGVPADERVVVLLDGHCDTVEALRGRWLEAIGGGIDAYNGLIESGRVDRSFLQTEIGYLPDEADWEHLVFGRGSADQLGGVVCQVFATRIAREMRSMGALKGITILSYATVAEEDNDGGGPKFIVGQTFPTAPADGIPDVVILTEGTGCAEKGAVGIYRGQRGRMQIEVVVTGRSCHGSMPWEGKNPLEYGGAIIAEATAQYDRRETFLDDPFLGWGSRTASDVRIETPSNCAVPERLTFRFDRRLTIGESPDAAVAAIEGLEAVARARNDGLDVSVGVPQYDKPTWTGYVPGNAEIYPGWITPAEHPAVTTAVACYGRVCSPLVTSGGSGGGLRKSPRLSRWVFSTDGVGFPIPVSDTRVTVPDKKRWVRSGDFKHPPMFGIGPGIEQNTHKIGECVDMRELPLVMAFLARFPALYRSAR